MNLEELGIPFTQLGEKKELELFWHISRSLVSKRYLQEILQLIVTMTAEVMGSKICSIMLLDEEKGELKIAASQSLSAEYLNKPNVKVGSSTSGRAVTERRPVVVPDLTLDADYSFPDLARREGITAMMSVPMVIDERVIGVINTYLTSTHEFTPDEIKMLQAVANQAAVAIENTKLREENVAARQALEQQTMYDRARAILMRKENLTDAEAGELMQKIADDQKMPLVEVASAVILVEELRQKKPGVSAPGAIDKGPA
jgi:GAF domain-containing protein